MWRMSGGKFFGFLERSSRISQSNSRFQKKLPLQCCLRRKTNTMKKLFWTVCSCLAFVVPTAFAESRGFRLTSSEWHDGGSVPQENVFNGSGCGGANISPEF